MANITFVQLGVGPWGWERMFIRDQHLAISDHLDSISFYFGFMTFLYISHRQLLSHPEEHYAKCHSKVYFLSIVVHFPDLIMYTSAVNSCGQHVFSRLFAIIVLFYVFVDSWCHTSQIFIQISNNSIGPIAIPVQCSQRHSYKIQDGINSNVEPSAVQVRT